MIDRALRVGGTEVALTDSGEGPVTVLLHGFTGNRWTMQDLADRIGGRTVTIDLPGHGDTVCPEGGEAFTMASHIEIVGAVIDAVSDGPVDLVGYSMGARVALSFAVQRPRRLKTLTLIGGSPGLRTERERRLRIVSDAKLAHTLHIEGAEKFVDHWMGLPMWESLRAAIGPDEWERSRQQRLTNTVQGLSESLIGIGTGAMPPLHKELHKLSMPVLLMVGELDTKFREIAAEMGEKIPDVRIKVAGGAGHAVHAERPDAAASVIRQFIGR